MAEEVGTGKSEEIEFYLEVPPPEYLLPVHMKKEDFERATHEGDLVSAGEGIYRSTEKEGGEPSGVIQALESDDDDDTMTVRRCPACGHTGPEAIAFSVLAAGFNGIKPGDAEDLGLLECGECAVKFDPNEVVDFEGAGFESDEFVRELRELSKRLESAPNAGEASVLFVNWCEDEREDEDVQMIRTSAYGAAMAIFGQFTEHGDEDVPRVSKRAVAALLHYIADTLEE